MRISVDRDDPGYSPSAYGTKVWLDGCALKLVITADDVRGEVLRHKPGRDGKAYANRERTETVKETLIGSVFIERNIERCFVLPEHL